MTLSFYSKALKKVVHFSLLFMLTFLAYSALFTYPRYFIFGEFVFWSYGNSVVKSNFLNFGQIGLWDNLGSIGYPLMADISSLFYPLTIPIFIISDSFFSLNLIAFIHIFLGSVAFYYLIRILDHKPIVALIGALVYSINNYVISVLMVGWMGEIYNLVWMPLTIACLWVASSKKKTIYAVFAGVAFSMDILSMSVYPIFFLNIIAMTLFVYLGLIVFLYKKDKVKEVVSLVRVALVFYLTTIGLSAVKLLPVLEYKSLSVRDVIPLYQAQEHIMTIADLPQRIFPVPLNSSLAFFLLGNGFYIFCVLLSLAKFDKATVFFWVLTIISIWSSLGNNVFPDVYQILYHVAPGINTMHFHFRFFIISHFSLTVLFAIGFSNLISESVTRGALAKKIVTIVSVSTLILLILYVKFYSYSLIKRDVLTSVNREESYIPDINLNEIVGKDQDEFRIASFYTPAGKDVTGLEALRFGYKLSNLADPAIATTYQYLDFDMLQNDDELLKHKYLLLGEMNTKYVIAEETRMEKINPYVTLQKQFSYGVDYNDPFRRRNDGAVYSLNTYRQFADIKRFTVLVAGSNKFDDYNAFLGKSFFLNSGNSDFAFVTVEDKISSLSYPSLTKFDAVINTDDNTKEKEFTDNLGKMGLRAVNVQVFMRPFSDIRARSKSILTNEPAIYLDEKAKASLSELLSEILIEEVENEGKVKDLKVTPERIVIRIDTHGQNVFLRVADAFYPGWVAKDNGDNAQIYMTNGSAKGIFIDEPGSHTIELIFKPKSFTAGFIITIITLTFVLSVVIHKARKKFEHE